VEGIKRRRSRRIRKSKKIRIQPLCGEYPPWVSYLSFEEEDCASFLCMILDWMWLREFSRGKNVCMKKREKHGKNIVLGVM
jgi:hypothetical protein